MRLGYLSQISQTLFFAEVARAFENSARESGYTLILCSTDHQTKREHEYIDLLFKKQVDGIIIATELNDYKLVKKNRKSRFAASTIHCRSSFYHDSCCDN